MGKGAEEDLYGDSGDGPRAAVGNVPVEIGELATSTAEMGVTVAVALPRSRTSTAIPATTRMTAAAMASGSQLRSRVSAEGTR
jgi:hypothetical protein